MDINEISDSFEEWKNGKMVCCDTDKTDQDQGGES